MEPGTHRTQPMQQLAHSEQGTHERGGGRKCWRGKLTTLGRGREEAYLDLLFAELVCELDDRVPCALADRLAEDIDVVNEVNLASSIDSDLVAGADRQTRIVARTEVHDALACSRVRLFIGVTGDGKLVLRRVRVQSLTSGKLCRIVVNRRGLCARGNVRAGGGRDTVPDVRACYRVGVVWLDVEHNGNDVHVEP